MVHVCVVVRELNILDRVNQPQWIWIFFLTVLKICYTFVSLSAICKARFSIHIKTMYAANARHSLGNRENFPHHVMGWNVWNTNININLSCTRISKYCSYFILKYEELLCLSFNIPKTCKLVFGKCKSANAGNTLKDSFLLWAYVEIDIAHLQCTVGRLVGSSELVHATFSLLLPFVALCVYVSIVLEQTWTI